MISNWKEALNVPIDISVMTKTLPTKGNLVYEYNPFRNYRLSLDMYEYKERLYNEADLKDKCGIEWCDFAVDPEKAAILDINKQFKDNLNSGYPAKDKRGLWILSNSVKITNSGSNYKFTYKLVEDKPVPRLKGELVDFVTSELNFDLKHPVNIIPLYSYDGSVNLILNDGKNQPRMINSRFSATGKDTYEIVDRKGSNDTNIYDLGAQFDVDTSLYKRVKQIPKLKLRSVTTGGALKCGNYHFYFKLADADGNETDFVAESGLVSIFIGSGSPHAIYSGNKNENAVKQVSFVMSNIDPSYSYVLVYYSRSTAEDGENRVLFYKKINRKFLVNNASESRILITGFDAETDVRAEDINLAYNIVDSANCAATAQGMLFLGNVHKPNIPYEELLDLSLRFLPYLKNEQYTVDIDPEYTIKSEKKGYYDPIYIYDKVGYWNLEIYRFGIVYILSNGELSPVFNIRGRENVTTFGKFATSSNIKTHLKNKYGDTIDDDKLPCDSLYSYFKYETDTKERIRIKSNEATNILIPPINTQDLKEGFAESGASFENVKGVVTLKSNQESRYIHAFEIRVEDETIERLRNLGIKGYFFVRLNRMPTVLAQGITIGIDKEGRVPTIPTQGGILTTLKPKLTGYTYVDVDPDAMNYVSEGFLSRYKFKLERKSSGLWGKIGVIAGAAALIVGAVAITVCTAGGAAPVSALMTKAGVGVAATALSSVIGTTSAVAVGAAVTAGAAAAVTAATVTSIAATGGEISLATKRSGAKLLGRNSVIPDGMKRVEDDDSRLLGVSFEDRLIIKDRSKNEVGAILCPDYDVAPQYYNQLFTGQEFVLKTTVNLPTALHHFVEDEYGTFKYYAFLNDGRHFYMAQNAYTDKSTSHTYISKLQAVPDDIACITIGKKKFRSKAGNASEAWRYECIGNDYKQTPSSYSKEAVEQSSETEVLTNEEIKQEVEDKQINSDIVRGSYGPYIGMDGYSGIAGETVSIMIPGYNENLLGEYFQIRMQDVSPFYAVSDRFDINDLSSNYISASSLRNDVSENKNLKFDIFRGDCYICLFTHRLNRNFNDDSSPYNSEVVDSKSWRDHYLVEKSEEFTKINVGDVNAINLGMWVTFTVRSNRNLNIRSLDSSRPAEVATMGHPRGFYPYHGMIAEGSYKSPEALVYNDGFCKNLGERLNFELPDSPYIRNWYGTRIMYSDIHVNDGFKNGYRVFLGQNYRDYTRQYGSIIKLLNYSQGSNEGLLVVFEHGLAYIPVNERAVAAQAAGGMAYINTSNVLPENPMIISESYGSIWPDSVIITPQDGEDPVKIFGVDTCAKKIWMIQGNLLTIISDLKVQEFLNLNLTLTEREKDPVMGIRNVKTVYNAYKHDVMFTFYDDLKGTEEKVWNLCYNTKLNKFITFYSWVPSYMENINNIPFSFDRTISKWIAKLGQSHSDNSFAEGIVLSNNIYNNDGTVDVPPYINYRYLTKKGDYAFKKVSFLDLNGLIGVFNLLDHVLPEGHNVSFFVKFELMRDIYGYYKNFEIRQVGTIKFVPEDNAKFDNEIAVYGLYFKPGLSKVYTQPNKLPVSSYKVDPVVGAESFTGLSSVPDLYFSELYYRNSAGNTYNDYTDHMVTASCCDEEHCEFELSNEQKALLPNKYKTIRNGKTYVKLTEENYFDVVQTLDLPVFHARDGKRPALTNPLYKKNLVQLLNIRAIIYAKYEGDDTLKNSLSLAEFMNYVKASNKNTYDPQTLIDLGYFNAGTYESSIAVTSKWNLQFLDSSFWKHGLAGTFDIAESIYPTMWYGEQHPFEFEVIAVNDPSVHKIFHNLEIISNKAQPESFHFEIVGEAYDFARDKPNMYFRQEARKALFLYNECDITYDRNFRKINPKQQAKSAELVHNYYERQDTLEDVYDTYNLLKDDKIIWSKPYYEAWARQTPNKDYSHLSGAELVYYPNRQEYRIWQHLPAINLDNLSQDTACSIIRGNCQYLEDKWEVLINPLLICYKNEYVRRKPGVLCQPENSTWPFVQRADGTASDVRIPPITIFNTCLPEAIKQKGEFSFPNESEGEGKDNALYGLYFLSTETPSAIDYTNWLNDVGIYKTAFGAALNRMETDLRDKFIKIRIRYSGKELAVIDFLNTIYTISYA